MTDAPWLTTEEMRAWRGWVRMSELLRAQINRDLVSESGVSDADYGVLVWLSEAPDQVLRMSELAQGLGWSKSRVSHQVARMESRGLLQRRGCPSDARGSYAALTPAGLAEVAAAAPRHVRSVRRHLFDRLDAAEVAELAAVTERIIGHLEALAPANTRPCPGNENPRPGKAAGASL